MPRLNELQDTLLPWRKLQGCRTLAASADGVDTHTHTHRQSRNGMCLCMEEIIIDLASLVYVGMAPVKD